MLKGMYIKMTEAEKAELQQLITFINAQKKDNDFTHKSEEEAVNYIMLVMADLKVTVSPQQIAAIYRSQSENIQEITDAVLALHKEKLDPDLISAFQTGLIISAIFAAPELFAVYAGHTAFKKLLEAKLGAGNWYTGPVSSLTQTGIMAAGYRYDSPYLNTLSLLNSNLPEVTKVSYARQIPTVLVATLLLQNAFQGLQSFATQPGETLKHSYAGVCKGLKLLQQAAAVPFNDEVVETAGDFFDMMHGQADEATIAKYKGSLAAKPIDEVVADSFNGICKGISWLYQRLPSCKRASGVAQAVPVIKTQATSSTKPA